MSFASKGLGYLAALLLLLPLLARYKLSGYQTTLLLTVSALADITLLKTTCHFLLLLIGFDTLTYRKELHLIPYLFGSSITMASSSLGQISESVDTLEEEDDMLDYESTPVHEGMDINMVYYLAAEFRAVDEEGEVAQLDFGPKNT